MLFSFVGEEERGGEEIIHQINSRIKDNFLSSVILFILITIDMILRL